MKPNNYTKKGFTLTELAIVIAIIAVLIAVLVPTFVSLINKANESSDKVLVSNLNKSLSITDEPDMVEIDSTKSLYNVTTAITSVRGDGYDVTKLSPTADGGDIVYNASTNKFIYYSNNFAELSYGEEPSSDDVLVVITDTTLSRYGVAEDSSSIIKSNTIQYCVYTTDSNVTITNETATVAVWVYTESGSLATINIPNGTIYHNGACTFASVTCADNSYHPMATIKGVEMQKGRYVKHVAGSVSYIYVDSENASNVTLEDVDTSETKVYSNESSVSIATSSSDGSSSTVSADNIYTEASNYYNNASAYSSLEDLFVSYTVVTAATCENNGVGVFITLFGTEVTVELSATDHNYDMANIAWAWSDDYSSATATIKCQNDTSHTQTINATVSSAITAATCISGGSAVYTATVTYSGTTYSNTETVTTAALGHTYEEREMDYVNGEGTVYTGGTIEVCTECGEYTVKSAGTRDTSKWTYISGTTTLKECNVDNSYGNDEDGYYLVVPYGTTKIADGADEDNGVLSPDNNVMQADYIILPETLTYIGNYAFYDQGYLIEITIPSSVTYIGVGAFQSCDELTSITIPASVTEIGAYAFSNCAKLATIVISENSALTTIGSYAFYQCNVLTSIILPSDISSIGSLAFFTGSKALTSIYYCGTAETWENSVTVAYALNDVHENGIYQFYVANSNSGKYYATVYFYSADEPTESGNYWYYNSVGDPEIWAQNNN